MRTLHATSPALGLWASVSIRSDQPLKLSGDGWALATRLKKSKHDQGRSGHQDTTGARRMKSVTEATLYRKLVNGVCEPAVKVREFEIPEEDFEAYIEWCCRGGKEGA